MSAPSFTTTPAGKGTGVGLPVLLISGYTELVDVAEWREAGISACLEKPFSLEELAVVLRQVLDASRIG
jgi:DNA-binding response OmpR family regulator